MPVLVTDSADLAERAGIGDGTEIRYVAQVCEHALIGVRAEFVARPMIGRGFAVAAGTTVVRDAPDVDFGLGVPALCVGRIGRAGVLAQTSAPKLWRCPTIKPTCREVSDNVMEELS